MRRTLLTILTALGLLATLGLTPATAANLGDQAALIPTQAVSYATFQTVTNTRSACAVVVPDVSYTIPVTAAVQFALEHTSRYGYHPISGYPGYELINGGAYPGQILVANRTRSGVYPPHQYDAFVPGYQGRSCSSWVHLVAQG